MTVALGAGLLFVGTLGTFLEAGLVVAFIVGFTDDLWEDVFGAMAFNALERAASNWFWRLVSIPVFSRLMRLSSSICPSNSCLALDKSVT